MRTRQFKMPADFASVRFDAISAAMRVARVLLTLAVAGTLCACTFVHYEYYPPASDAGRQCVVQCAGVREMCIGNENQRAQNDRYACEQRNHWNYQNCMRRADDKNDAKACSRSQMSCWANANTFRCDENYRGCYVSCGGRVDVIREK